MARIMVVGSVATDEVIRLSERCREGAHLNGAPAGARLGGGGANTAVALAAAGHHVTLVTAVGDDDAAQWQLARLAEAGVDISAVARVPGPSTRSILLVDPMGERTIINLGRAAEIAPPERLLHLPADLIYVRARARNLAELLEQRGRDCPVIAHVPPIAPGIFPAQIVLASASDVDDRGRAESWAMARQVAGERLQWMVLTKGAAGAEAISADHRVNVTAPQVEPLDSTGAGDAFAAGLCHALARGTPLPQCLETAVRWGAAKVTQDGSALLKETVEHLCRAEAP